MLCLAHQAVNNRVCPLKKFDKFLDRSHLPDDVDLLKDLLISALEELKELTGKVEVLSETIEYLNSQLSVLRRFQYGQRSERFKKKHQ